MHLIHKTKNHYNITSIRGDKKYRKLEVIGLIAHFRSLKTGTNYNLL